MESKYILVFYSKKKNLQNSVLYFKRARCHNLLTFVKKKLFSNIFIDLKLIEKNKLATIYY